MKTDPRIDAYIKKAQPFAQPILRLLRSLIHAICPEVEETVKWGMPHFEYKGVFIHFASFKAHCVFSFWKQVLMDDPAGIFSQSDQAMGSLGRITSMKDLPPDDVLRMYIQHAMEINDKGLKVPAKKIKSVAIKMPTDLKEKLSENKKALAVFEQFSNSHKKEYIEWIVGAKRPETRLKRLDRAIEMMTDGKSLNSKYESKKQSSG